jgi:hypothetical protein
MPEAARYLQDLTARYDALLIIFGAIAAVLSGLFIWLGGLGVRKIATAAITAAIVSGCVYFMVYNNLVYTIACGVVAAGLAIVFERIFLTATATVTAFVLGTAFLLGPHIANAESYRQFLLDTPAYLLVATICVTPAFGAASLISPNIIFSICFSAIGTTLIFSGMILLTSYKGSYPADYIAANKYYFLSVFAAMTGFGAFIQLFLCRRFGKKTKKGKQTEQKQSEAAKQGWRTS